MVQAVIFDVGGVLVRTEDPGIRRQWEADLGLSAGESERIVFNSEMGTRAQLGEIGEEALWAWVGEHLSLSDAVLGEFRRGFWAGDELDTELADLIRGLRPRYQTAVISNATDALLTNLSVKYPVADAFDLIVGSASEGMMKPDPRIFQRTLDRLGRKPEESVFVDDFYENVKAARQLGMHVIHFQRDTDVAAELASLGVT